MIENQKSGVRKGAKISRKIFKNVGLGIDRKKRSFICDYFHGLKNNQIRYNLIQFFLANIRGNRVGTYAYLRVSTDQQDLDNQRHGILEYSNSHSISGLQFVEDNAAGKVKWKERKLGDLLVKTMQPGDTVLFAEVSRMARSTLQILEILEHCAKQGFIVHIVKQSMVFDDSLNSKITATVMGLAAEIEREFISMRTKEALAKRKAAGVVLGRPRGRAKKLKLDKKSGEIRRYLELGLSKAAICKLVGCSPSTLYEWIERRT